MDSRRKSTHEELIAASEAVHNEMNSVAALKRLSIGNSLTYDPDLPYTEKNEFSLEKSGYEDITEDFDTSISSSESGVIKYGETVIDTNELLWVPAQYHPNISPEKFRKHIQSSVDQITEKLNQISEIKAGIENPQSTNLNTFMDSRGVSKDSNSSMSRGLSMSPSSRRRSRSISSSLSENQEQPTIVQLTQELQKLSEIAGLNSTDAASLARSLSSSSLGFTSFEKSAYGFRSPDESTTSEPSFTMQSGSQLKRSRWTTYRKNGSSVRKGRSYTANSSKDNNTPQPENSKNKLSKESSTAQVAPSSQDPLLAEQEKLSTKHELLRELSSQSTNSIESPQHLQFNESAAHLQQQVQPVSNTKTQEPAQADSKIERVEPKNLPSSSGRSISLKSAASDKKTKKSSWTSFKDRLSLNNEPISNDNEKKADLSPLPARHTRNRHGSVINAPISQQLDSSVEEYAYEPDNKENELREKGTISKFFGLKSKSRSQSGPSFRTGKGKHKKNDHANTSIGGSDSDGSVDSEDKITEKLSKVGLHKRDRKSQHQTSNMDRDANDSFSKTSFSGKTPSASQHFVERSQEENGRTLAQQASANIKATIKANDQATRPNGPMQYTDSAFGFPLPPPSKSTLVMLDYRFPIHIERAIYRLSHLKLADPRRPLRQQVLLSNFMYAYLNLVNHTLYLQQVDEGNAGLTSKIEL